MSDDRTPSRTALKQAWNAVYYWAQGDDPIANYDIGRDAWMSWFGDFYDCAMRWEMAPERLAERAAK